MIRKISEFMRERNGMDPLGKFLMILIIILFVFCQITIKLMNFNIVLRSITAIIIIYFCFRLLSKNIEARQFENTKYLYYKSRVLIHTENHQKKLDQLKTHHIYTCHNCKQKIRIPRKKGKIEISCPRCHRKFRRYSW